MPQIPIEPYELNMIKEIEFANYRIFAEKQKLVLAPITIVFGKNNVGKSALLKLPVLIKSILSSAQEDTELFEKSAYGLRICENYSDVVYGKAHRAINLSMTDGTNNVSLDFFVESKGNPRTQIEKMSGVLYDGTEITNRNQLHKIFNFDIEYLKSIRDYPKDGYFSLSEIEADFSQSGGMFAYKRLVNDSNYHSEGLCAKVSNWYEQTFDGWGIEVDNSRDPIFSVHLKHDNIKTNILDGGAGIAQSLPVIVSAATPIKAPKLFIYEEPETHLHPEAHGDSAEFIAKEAISSDGNKNFLIESHSVNFLLRLRRLVADGTLRKEDVALYYVEFDPDKSQSKLKPVKVNSDGSVNGWPEDVFKETLEETLALRRAQLQRKEGAAE